ncbi:MAG: cellulase family glycosylhydrolase [Lachnospiraceae bacterium]|nr:cellulase family glycosylhydrolase [Lachnospiraceae bacterium]
MKLDRGINLGGYLSQCCHSAEHYDSFIGKEDVKLIAESGFDHIRLPIDYEVLETDEGDIREQGYARVRRVIDWCVEYDRNVILDLHKAYGYDFNDAGNEEKNSLFASEKLQQRFIRLWRRMAEQFATYPNVAFELLNEVVEKENAPAWNSLIRRTLSEIRQISKTVPVIYGGIQWNSVKTLKLLEIPNDPNVIFTFHFYEPLLFTHQKAPWVETMAPNQTVPYPETMEYYRRESKKLGFQGEVVTLARSQTMGTQFIEEMIKEAIDAAQKAGVSLYCGEFGVIDRAPAEDTLRWFQDVNTVFTKYHIGCAVWSYKEMDFGITDAHYAPIRDALFQLWGVKPRT